MKSKININTVSEFKFTFLIILTLFCKFGFSQHANYGNVYIPANGFTTLHNENLSFQYLNDGTLPGMIGTERNGTLGLGYYGFAGTASWSGASDTGHIDGYARSYKSTPFIFPIGDNGRYRPARVSIASQANPAAAAYFGVSPSLAITSSLKGGNEPILPTGTYNTLIKALSVQNVSTSEYWDIDGAESAKVSLTWDASSGISAMTGGDLSKLTIVGWDGAKWVALSCAVDATSIIGGSSSLTSGSITTTVDIVPSTYTVYTLASRDIIIADTKDTTSMNNTVSKTTGSPVSGPGITVVAVSQKGTVTVNPDGTVNYKPNPNFTGIDTIRRTVCDTSVAPPICGTSLIIMVVSPVLKDSLNNGKMNTPVNIGNPITLGPGASQRLEGPSNGTVTVNPDGTLKYTPKPNFVGLDTVRQIVCVDGICDTAVLVIRVEPNISDRKGDTKVGTPVVIAGPVLIPGNGTSIAHTGIGGPSKGIATVDPITGAVTYTPNAGFIGNDTVVVRTCVIYIDGVVKCDTHLVVISVGILYKTNPDIAIGNKGDQITGNVGTNDKVVAGTTYGTPVAASSNPTSAVPVMNPDGTYTFTTTTPGTYVFTVPVCSPGQTTGCPTETLTITVLDPSSITNKPIVVNDESVTKPGSPSRINVLANDGSGNVGFPLDKSSLVISTAPKNGVATINSDGTVTYTPKPGFVGFDTFYYTICDSVFPPNCGIGRVIVNVTNANIGVVQDDIARGSGVIAGNTLVNDKFPVGTKPYVKPQDIVIAGKGRFVIDSLGNYRWIPESGFVGSVQILITTCDGLFPETCYNSTIHINSTANALDIVVPNYFSPNGDGINDVWNLDNLLSRYPKAKVLIYNRWGNIVWRSTGPYGLSTSGKNIWYGQLEGSQDNVPDGVYYYLLELDDEFKTTKTGFIEIMRQ